MKKIFNFIVKIFNTSLKIILYPFKILFKLIQKWGTGSSKPKISNLEDLAIKFYEEYEDKIMFKLELGTNGENLTIYSSNFKTTLEKAKKRQKDVIETEIIEKP